MALNLGASSPIFVSLSHSRPLFFSLSLSRTHKFILRLIYVVWSLFFSILVFISAHLRFVYKAKRCHTVFGEVSRGKKSLNSTHQSSIERLICLNGENDVHKIIAIGTQKARENETSSNGVYFIDIIKDVSHYSIFCQTFQSTKGRRWCINLKLKLLIDV